MGLTELTPMRVDCEGDYGVGVRLASSSEAMVHGLPAAACLGNAAESPICFTDGHVLVLPQLHATMRLKCGHEICSQCMVEYISVKCQEAKKRVQNDLVAHDAELGGPDSAAGHALDGNSLVELGLRGQIRQCPCGYGPVVNTHCSDMRAHDVQHGTGTNRTTNSCPRCSFFSPNWSDWHAWNMTRIASAVLCPLCMQQCFLDDGDALKFQGGLADAEEGRESFRRKLNTADMFMALLHQLLADQDDDDGNWFSDRSLAHENLKDIALAGLAFDGLQQALRDGLLRDLLRKRLTICGLAGHSAGGLRRRSQRSDMPTAATTTRTSLGTQLLSCVNCRDVSRTIRGQAVCYADGPRSGPLHFGCLDPDRAWMCFGAPTSPPAELQADSEDMDPKEDTAQDINSKIFAECVRIGASASKYGVEEQARSLLERRRVYALACLLVDPSSPGPRTRDLASEQPWEWHAEIPDAMHAVLPGMELMPTLFHDICRLRRILGLRDSHVLRFVRVRGTLRDRRHGTLRGRRDDFHTVGLLEMLLELDSRPPRDLDDAHLISRMMLWGH